MPEPKTAPDKNTYRVKPGSDPVEADCIEYLDFRDEWRELGEALLDSDWRTLEHIAHVMRDEEQQRGLSKLTVADVLGVKCSYCFREFKTMDEAEAHAALAHGCVPKKPRGGA